MSIKNPASVAFLPLKDLDGTMLTLALHAETSTLPARERRLLDESIMLAAYMHRADTRRNAVVSSKGKENQPSSPYILHPLRNTVRLARWGVRDIVTLAGSILHDIVEDHAVEIVDECTDRDPSKYDETRIRMEALHYLEDTFGDDVAMVVEGVSNPILDHKEFDKAARNVEYAIHVKKAIVTDPRIFLVKFADFCDNALSLHHQASNASTVASAKKYVQIADEWAEALEHWGDALSTYVNKAGLEDISERAYGAESYLNWVISR